MNEVVLSSVMANGDETPSVGNTPETEAVLRALRRILRRVSLHSRQLVRSGGLTVPQALVLRAATGGGPTGLTVAQISAQVRLSPPTVTGILDRLERQGFILRERGIRDRRHVFIVPTESGKEQLAHVPQPLHESFIHRFEGLPEQERAQLLQSVERIVELMEADQLDASPMLTAEPEMKS